MKLGETVTPEKVIDYLNNRPHFLGVYQRNKPTRDVGRTREKLRNHEPSPRGFITGFIALVNP